MNSSCEISVVIASHRPDYIQACIDSLIASRELFPASEIIVVADYPHEVLAQHNSAITWIFHAHRSISAKRNVGAAIARGSLIAFTDDDCYVDINWIASGVSYCKEHGECVGVEGHTTVEVPAVAIAGPLREYKRLEKRGYRTNNIVYRAEAFRAVNGFDERFELQREDMDLAFSMLALGKTIDYCEDLCVTHRLRANEPWDLLKSTLRRRWDPLLYKKHKRLYRGWIGSPCTLSFSMSVALQLCIATAFAGLLPAPGVCIGILVVVLSFFAGRRIGRSKVTPVQFGIEILSYLIGPWILFAVLIGASWKYKTFLIY